MTSPPSQTKVIGRSMSVRCKTTGWKRRFDDPSPLSNGRQLLTLREAAGYIMKLPKAEQTLEE